MMRTANRTALFSVLLLIATVAIYWPGLGGPLLFDDKAAISGNDLVQIDGRAFEQWREASLSSNSGPLRRPIAMLSFAVNHALTGSFSPFALKATNLAIHAATSVLLYFLFLAVLESFDYGPDRGARRLLALTAAALWLLHPLNVSTVLYAVQRMAQLAALFTVAGLLVFMRHRQRWAQQGASPGEVLALALWLLLLTLLAMLCKENGVLLPWLVVVLEVCIFRGCWSGRQYRPLQVAAYLALILPVILALLVLLLSPETLLAGYAGREFTLTERILTQTRLLWRYLGWICWPNINDMGFQHDDIPLSTSLLAPPTTALAIAAWTVLLPVAWFLRRRWPLLLLAVLFFLVGPSLESGVLPLEMVYEHRNYLPVMMVCLLLSSVVIMPFLATEKVGVMYPVLGVVAIFGMLLAVRVQTWSDELTLSRVNLANHPESSRSNYFYANALLRHYRRAEDLGLSDQERADSLLLSRHFFERMYQTNPRDVAALVMLYYLDAQFFTEIEPRTDWLDILEKLLATRNLQPSDWNAMSTLFEVLQARDDPETDARVRKLLQLLSYRYPQSLDVLRFQYQYLASRKAGFEELMTPLRRAQALRPGTAWIYYYLIYEQGRAKDTAALWETARDWLANDPGRYNLLQVKALFSQSDSDLDAVGN